MVTTDFPRPIVTVDIAMLTPRQGELCVALLRRSAEPFANAEALIGGYLRTDEDDDAESAVRRILSAKAGVEGIFFEQLRTFASATRDPRDWSVSIAYFALLPEGQLETSEMLSLKPAAEPGQLPFDHNEIIREALNRLRSKGAYSTIPARLLPEVFTMSELLSIYQTVMGERLDQSAFRRKVRELDLLEEIEGEKRQTESARRPTTLYRLKRPVSVFDRRL
ncbi:NUDIX hydrolase [Agrobacterium tumefaciens]|uniref:NUDIX hydrolase n=1 Tax=Agrobacterium tumefaciens TaxID=358 RepID=UPI0015717322|nr:NUDIX hydrolase [Agrobacterium tumefaciens]NTE57485.1 NUDIX hydrolase [Agrobacterium tumefaciens]NTE69979.1 NUDIX hydrolase [Agrobacterium tumefaciens]